LIKDYSKNDLNDDTKIIENSNNEHIKYELMLDERLNSTKMVSKESEHSKRSNKHEINYKSKSIFEEDIINTKNKEIVRSNS
jgi:hypothetical protein